MKETMAYFYSEKERIWKTQEVRFLYWSVEPLDVEEEKADWSETEFSP